MAWIIGWDLMLEYLLAASTVAIGWSGYFQILLNGFGIYLPAWASAAFGSDPKIPAAILNLPAVAIALLITLLLSLGVKNAARFNNVIVFIKLAVILLFIIVASWITGIVVAVIAGFTPINEVAQLVNIGTLSAFVFVSIGVIVLRKTQPNLHRSFRVPWVPLVPILAALSCLILMYQLPLITWIRFVVWLAIGLIIYFSYGIRHSALNKSE